MSIVVDSSVAVKWLVMEPDSGSAVPLRTLELPAPDLLHAEIASILWKKVRLKLITPDIARNGMAVIKAMGIRTVPNNHLANVAISLACALDHSPYDMFYVALAIEMQVPLVTADGRLVARIRQERPIWSHLITPLTEFHPGGPALSPLA